jgi:hypothetical protein
MNYLLLVFQKLYLRVYGGGNASAIFPANSLLNKEKKSLKKKFKERIQEKV